MTLYDLLETVNDNTVVQVFSSETCECIATYDGKESIPEEYDNCEVTDIFTGVAMLPHKKQVPTLCIEIEEE